jgi:peptide/nickel transport system substrate-binding protein
MIAAYRPRHRLVLIRNPSFRAWSPSAQPDGYPDRIEVRLDVPESRRVDAVLRGEADYAGGVLGGISTVRTQELLTQHAAQTHIEPQLTTIGVFLNTRVAPFDDKRVRRALNYGIDRRTVVRAAGGRSSAAATCQILPPNLPGYVRYCPYGTPDIGKARRLVAASGTRGMRVTVWSVGFLTPAIRPVVALLSRLGYRASVKTVPSGVNYAKQIADSRTRAQAGVWYWAADYPAPSDFLQVLLSCAAFVPRSADNLNMAEFCDPAIDARMRLAARTQSVNSELASRRWARAERAIVDAAPWLPLYNPRSVELLSRRAGGHRYSPIYGTLIGQLWVR